MAEIEHLDLQTFDAVFLDVYFWSDQTEIESNSGKEESYVLLEKIRELAPWLPVIALTQHIDQGKLTYEISKRQYDLIVPKKLIRSYAGFCQNLFDEIVDFAVFSRQKEACNKKIRFQNLSCLGQELDSQFAFEVDYDSDDFLSEYFQKEEIGNFLSVLFPYHDKVVITKLSDGYSGNQTFKVEASNSQSRFGKNSSWFLKMGPEIYKLQEEIDSYYEILSSGIHHRFFPFLYHGKLISKNAIGAILYQLENDSKTLSERLKRFNRECSTKVIEETKIALKEIQGEHRPESGLIKNHFFSVDSMSSIFGELHDSVLVPDALRDYDTIQTLENKSVTFRLGLVHGDLHTNNILVGVNNEIYLIDFAKADYKPVVFDALKLEFDIIANAFQRGLLNKDDLSELLNGSQLDSELEGDIFYLLKTIRKEFILNDDNITAMEWYVGNISMCLRFLTYESISNELKNFYLQRSALILNIILELN